MRSDVTTPTISRVAVDFATVIAATAHWLVSAYPPAGGSLARVYAEAQARQAATVAAWLRYPTATDVALLELVGPSGSAVLDELNETAGFGDISERPADQEWRSWVDEDVASWAACLLMDSRLTARAIAMLTTSEHFRHMPRSFRILAQPNPSELRAAMLLRHPDLIGPVARLHRDALLDRLHPSSAPI